MQNLLQSCSSFCSSRANKGNKNTRSFCWTWSTTPDEVQSLCFQFCPLWPLTSATCFSSFSWLVTFVTFDHFWKESEILQRWRESNLQPPTDQNIWTEEDVMGSSQSTFWVNVAGDTLRNPQETSTQDPTSQVPTSQLKTLLSSSSLIAVMNKEQQRNHPDTSIKHGYK